MEKTTSLTQSLKLEITLPVLAFLIPFLVPGPQWLTGTVVNAFLFLFVTKLSGKNLLPIVMLPSIGAILNGVVFGTFTPFLLYFMPLIWLGNYVMVRSFQFFLNEGKVYTGSVFISAVAKTLILFLSTVIFVQLHVVPAIFLTAMGIVQLGTAIAGGALAYGVMKAKV